MLFNSAAFALFFPAVTVAYFATPARRRWLTLLVASSVFYMAFIPAYVLILYAMILVDYAAGLLIEASSGRRRTAMLLVSLACNIGVLALFKYYNFAAHTLASVAPWFVDATSVPRFAWVLPIGLSFHTFQAMAYTIEVYEGRYRAERHLGMYALYVMFYPQLVAGPIERPGHLLPQLHRAHVFDPERVGQGLKLMAWGLFKKVVIADRLASAVNTVYAAPAEYHAPAVILATVFFAFQIYCDFSGYTDIAIGAAQVMGIDLVTNFRRPYLAGSIREFWMRWHISLSTWFRDYLYIPLGGNRCSRPRWFFNLATTFLISGLWHGANWTFVIWGSLHGAYLIGGIVTAPARGRLKALVGLDRAPRTSRALAVMATFVLVSIAWVFFRAGSVHAAIQVLSRMLDWSSFDLLAPALSPREALFSIGLVAWLWTVEVMQPEDDIRSVLRGAPACVRWPVYYGLVLTTLALGVFAESRFIYFQF